MPPTTARDILDKNVTAFETTTSVEQAIDAIRTSTSGSDHTVYYAYVVDDDGMLQGVISLRELLNSGSDTSVSEIATESVVSVRVSETLDDLATIFARNKFMALPVVDEAGSLQGIVKAGDVIEALDGASSKEVLKETIRDVKYDPAEESAYECFSCGTIVTAIDSPDECPNCGDDLRHRRTPIE